ncbi:glycoside hydrolase family 16 protein [Polyporus arcularius HHB13444]|uniref:Glycoside hydrolase family 16 protein n=1 Tax=Polyporus arcularius HHB13444 TaxID=1314778 RepID=A0A5C3PUE9_9APHY|nr:glycoside hydrolase family 16 protein [Polyporus arcularius HHB13444]
MFPSTCALCMSLLLPAAVLAQYNLVKEYAGESFFDDWSFYGNRDNLTNGNVNFLDDTDAFHNSLAFVNDAGNAVMKVDNSSSLKFNQNRNSIRISSKDQFTVGSVWVADILHVPYGCSVWGAFWSSAPTWPLGGEIDTFEAVNKDARGHMGLHTNPGCTHSSNAVQSSTLINSTDCSIQANNNQGCIITNPDPASYGEAFAKAGGGVYVTEFAIDGISIWFFNRTDLPSSLQGNVSAIDTSTLGIPVANWPTDGCSVNEFFQPQELVFDITLCGDYAGAASVFYQTCTGVCYNDWVLGDPSNYDTAYFEVSYVRVYGLPGELTVIQSSGGPRSAEVRGFGTLMLALCTLFATLWTF